MRNLKLKLGNFTPDKIHVTESPIAFRPLIGVRQDTEWFPDIEVTQGPAEYLVQADLPGIRASQVVVTVDVASGASLSIAGERWPPRSPGDKTLLAERSFGTFVRCLTLPEDALIREIPAALKDGVLEVRIPLAHPERQNEASQVSLCEQPQDTGS